MDRVSSLSESNISTLCLGYTKFRYEIIQIGTISIEAPNRNSQLEIYIKSLSTGYQSQLIIKISIQDLYISEIILSSSLFSLLWKQNRVSWSDQLIFHLYNEYAIVGQLCIKNCLPTWFLLSCRLHVESSKQDALHHHALHHYTFNIKIFLFLFNNIKNTFI